MIFKEILTTKNLVFLILLIILLKFVQQVSDIAMLFFACFVLACSMLPLVNFLECKTKNRSLSAGIIVSGAVVLTFAFVLPVLSITIQQITMFAQSIPNKLVEFQHFLQNFNINGYKLTDFVNLTDILEKNTDIAQNILSQSLNITIGFVQLIIVFIAVITILFYLLKDTTYIREKFLEFFPEKMKKKANDISIKIAEKVGGYVIATIISGLAIWFLISLFLLIMKVDYAFSLGLIAGVLDIIPVLGPTIALTLIILSATKKGIWIVAMAIILFLGVQQISNNIVRPVVFGKFMDMHPLVVIFSLLVGGKFGGLLGLIFAPAIAAIISVLIDELYLKTINKVK